MQIDTQKPNGLSSPQWMGNRGGVDPASSAIGTVHMLKFLKLEGKAVQAWMKEIRALN